MSKSTTTDTVQIDWRQARRDSARAAILECAWAIVRERGLTALSLRHLARRAGITTPTVYAYFASKNDIYDAMFGQAAEEFAAFMAAPGRSDDPRDDLKEKLERFAEFCLADLARYQLLFQHVIPDFSPGPQSYAPAQRALESTQASLAGNGITEPAHVDLWTAVSTGLVSQQIANDPDGDRWTRLIDDAVAMYLDYCRPEHSRPTRRTRS